MQSYHPCQYLQLATLMLMVFTAKHNHKRGLITRWLMRTASQHGCFQKSPRFDVLAISSKPQFMYFLFISSPQPSCDS